MTKIAFFDIRNGEKEYFQAHLTDADGFELYFYDKPLSESELPERFDFDIIAVFMNSTVNAVILQKFPNLKYIATRSTGFDHIDLAACKQKNIIVSNVPAYGENTVAEYAFALILALARKIPQQCEIMHQAKNFNPPDLQGFDLKGKTLGVVGTGRIGRHVIRMAKGFEMRVVAYDVILNHEYAKEMQYEYLPLNDVFMQSDIVTLHVPALPATHHLINSKNISHIKRGAYIINTSRGSVIETGALLKALQSGQLGGAGLDVLEEEGGMQKGEMDFLREHSDSQDDSMVADIKALINLPNVIITPHNAYNTREAVERIMAVTVENIKAFLESKPINII